MAAGGLPVNARNGGRLGLRLGLLYSRKATARSARRGARPGLLGQRRVSLAKSPESDPRTHAIGTGPGLGLG